MAFNTGDLLPDSAFIAIADLIGAMNDRIGTLFGVVGDSYATALVDAGVTSAAVPAPGGTMSTGPLALDSDEPPVGTIHILPYVAVIECVGVQNNDTVTVGGTVLTAKSPYTGAPGTFDASSTDEATLRDLGAKIAALSPNYVQFIYFYDRRKLYVGVNDLLDLPPVSLATSTAARILLSSDSFGGTHESVRYRARAAGVFTVQERGADGTRPSAHPSGAPIVVPSSVDRLARGISESINGDGAANPGIGAAYTQAIVDLSPALRDAINTLSGDSIAAYLAFPYMQAIENHLLKIARDALTASPSYNVDVNGAPLTTQAILTSLSDYLRYKNDRTSGVPYGLTVSDEFAYWYWLFTGGLPIDPSGVFAPRTTLATYTQGSGVSAILSILTRYSVPDPALRTQGVVAARLRARVTVAGTGNATAITAWAQGAHSNGAYYGRGRSAGVVFGSNPAGTTNQPNNNDTVKVNAVTFTCKTAAPAAATEFQRGATNADTAANFAATFNLNAAGGTFLGSPVTALAALAGMVASVVAASALATITPGATDYANYLLVVTNGSREGISAGTMTGLTTATFGGGHGAQRDGLGSDSDVTGTPADDDPVQFTNNAVNLDLSAVGNCVDLVNGSTGDRALYLIPSLVAATTAGTSGGEQFVIESVPERWLH